MSTSDPHDGILDFFPAYQPYGLREIALTDDPIQLLRWISSVCLRSFDSLSFHNRDAFTRTTWKYLSDTENRAAWDRAQELIERHPHPHPDDVGLLEVSTVATLNALLDSVLQGEADADVLAELVDTLHHGAALVVRLHEQG